MRMAIRQICMTVRFAATRRSVRGKFFEFQLQVICNYTVRLNGLGVEGAATTRPILAIPRRGVMHARIFTTSVVFVPRKQACDPDRGSSRDSRFRVGLAAFLCLLLSGLAPVASAQSQSALANQSEVQQLRKEVNDLRESLRR